MTPQRDEEARVVGQGGDPRAMERVAAHMDDQARALESDVGALEGESDAAFWRGDDADAFRTRLAEEHAVAVRSAASAIREAADRLRAEAAEQEHASGT